MAPSVSKQSGYPLQKSWLGVMTKEPTREKESRKTCTFIPLTIKMKLIYCRKPTNDATPESVDAQSIAEKTLRKEDCGGKPDDTLHSLTDFVLHTLKDAPTSRVELTEVCKITMISKSNLLFCFSLAVKIEEESALCCLY
jgi:hypothetical protein